MSQLQDLQIELSQEDDGSYYAHVTNLPGCFSMWETIEELNINLKEAINLYLLSLQKDLFEFKFN